MISGFSRFTTFRNSNTAFRYPFHPLPFIGNSTISSPSAASESYCDCTKLLTSPTFLFPLATKITFITSDFDNSPQEKLTIVGNWDFTYHNDKTMQLAISRDGIARASSGTKYSWRLSGNNIEIFMEDMVSYKGLVTDGLMSGTATSIYNPNGWPWFAKRRNDGLTIEDLTSGSWTIVNDVDDLEDNIVLFLSDNTLNSDLYGHGKWSLDGDQLEIITADDFIKYTAKFVKGEIVGKGRNRIANEWNFKLLKNN